MTPHFSLVRLIAALPVLALLLVPAYLLLMREPSDPNVRPAALLDTESADGVPIGLDLGERAPDFEFSTPEGDRARLSDFRGRALVVNFWATWCTSCLTEMPDLKALQTQLGPNAFNVLAVNAGESRPDAEEFIDFLEAPFVYALDPGLVLTDAYGVYGLPLSVFIDATGIVRGVYRGHANPEVLDTYVTAAIEAQPPGEVPVVLRIVTTIYRERVLAVSTTGSGNLTFASKSLRCDVSYCAEAAVTTALGSLDGVASVEYAEASDGEGKVVAVFDPDVLSDDAVVGAIRSALEALPDPVYTRPIEVRFDD
jgi:thiol-disulfide isomerase/thioredoxin